MILIFMVEGARELARERERERKRGPGQEGLKMGGPFMVEIVFCRVTRRGRKKKAGMNKLARENCRNDGPMGGGFIPPDTLKITLDLSDIGPSVQRIGRHDDEDDGGRREGKNRGQNTGQLCGKNGAEETSEVWHPRHRGYVWRRGPHTKVWKEGRRQERFPQDD